MSESTRSNEALADAGTLHKVMDRIKEAMLRVVEVLLGKREPMRPAPIEPPAPSTGQQRWERG